eukprot:m.184028 g.184028  ORF g.184028 m.184028 type:complete len:248 (+) comp16010_c0_seq1:114-857(+)
MNTTAATDVLPDSDAREAHAAGIVLACIVGGVVLSAMLGVLLTTKKQTTSFRISPAPARTKSPVVFNPLADRRATIQQDNDNDNDNDNSPDTPPRRIGSRAGKKSPQRNKSGRRDKGARSRGDPVDDEYPHLFRVVPRADEDENDGYLDTMVEAVTSDAMHDNEHDNDEHDNDTRITTTHHDSLHTVNPNPNPNPHDVNTMEEAVMSDAMLVHEEVLRPLSREVVEEAEEEQGAGMTTYVLQHASEV